MREADREGRTAHDSIIGNVPDRQIHRVKVGLWWLGDGEGVDGWMMDDGWVNGWMMDDGWVNGWMDDG